MRKVKGSWKQVGFILGGTWMQKKRLNNSSNSFWVMADWHWHSYRTTSLAWIRTPLACIILQLQKPKKTKTSFLHLEVSAGLNLCFSSTVRSLIHLHPCCLHFNTAAIELAQKQTAPDTVRKCERTVSIVPMAMPPSTLMHCQEDISHTDTQMAGEQRAKQSVSVV